MITSSPTSLTTGTPSPVQASTFAPSDRACSSPRYTGSVGTPPTKAVQTSVPPDIEKSHVSRPSASYTQSNPSGESGDPVDPTDVRLDSVRPARGSTPPLLQAAMYPADVPKQVTPASSARSQSVPRSGCPGLPS